MKKSICLIPLILLFLSGCATYSLKKGAAPPYNKGYIVTRYDRLIPEYTIGKDNMVPEDEQLARARFQRRRVEVESYYKKMGYIENRFRQNFVDPPVFMIRSVIGMLRLPFIAMDDYKYNHDPKYRESVDKKEDAEYKAEKERINALKAQLNAYITEDLSKEPGAAAPVVAEKETVAVTAVAENPPAVEAVTEPAPLSKKEFKPEPVIARSETARQAPGRPVAVIIAKPGKGPSPLLVQFNGSRSSSPKSRIVAYLWDFGDGDTSPKKNPTNTYWSATFGSRKFPVTLTVTDARGETAQASAEIEVINK